MACIDWLLKIMNFRFGDLPPELQHMVINHADNATLHNLCLTNKTFNKLATWELYDHVRVTIDCPAWQNAINAQASPTAITKGLRYTRKLTIQVLGPCLHRHWIQWNHPNEILFQIRRLLALTTTNGLRILPYRTRFSWTQTRPP